MPPTEYNPREPLPPGVRVIVRDHSIFNSRIHNGDVGVSLGNDEVRIAGLQQSCSEWSNFLDIAPDQTDQTDQTRCPRCLHPVGESEMVEVDGFSYRICPDCASRYHYTCLACNETFYRRYSSDFCPNCEDDYFVCESCGSALHNDDYGEDGLCQSCLDERRGSTLIHEHHSKLDLPFKGESPDDLFFGVELETDRYRDAVEDAAAALVALSKDQTLFYLEEDGSLSNGIEIISCPASLSYHLETFPWADIATTIRKFGGHSNSTQTCGLHIHFSRAFFRPNSALQTVKFLYLFEKFWEELLKFSRRDPRDLGYCRKNKFKALDRDPEDKVEQYQRDDDRYQAVNLTNSNTIEVRIFRGTLTPSQLKASIELVDFLARTSKTKTIKQLQAITWRGLVKRIKRSGYLYLPQEIKDREIEKDLPRTPVSAPPEPAPRSISGSIWATPEPADPTPTMSEDFDYCPSCSCTNCSRYRQQFPLVAYRHDLDWLEAHPRGCFIATEYDRQIVRDRMTGSFYGSIRPYFGTEVDTWRELCHRTAEIILQ